MPLPRSADGALPPSRSVARGRAWPIAKCLTLGFSLAISLAVGEVTVRQLTARDGMNFTIEMWRYARQVKRPSSHPAMSHEHVPGAQAHLMGVDVQINSQGLRAREYPLEKPPGTYRILVLGDSMTFGWGTRVEEAYPARLEAALNGANTTAACQRFEVLNAGVGNYNTSQEVTYFQERGKDWHADLVLLGYFINDAEPTPRAVGRTLGNYSQLYVYLAGQADGLTRRFGWRPGWLDYYRALYATDAPGWLASQQAIRDLAAMQTTHGFRLAIALIPELHQLGSDYPFRQVHAQLAALGNELHVPVWDLLPAFDDVEEPTVWVSPGDAHANARGHQLAAEEILRHLRPLLEQSGACGNAGDGERRDVP